MRYHADIPDSEPTPQEVFFNRRTFIRAAAAASILPAAVSCARGPQDAGGGVLTGSDKFKPPFERPEVFPAKRNGAYVLPTDVDRTVTEQSVAGTHTNFYEFLPGRAGDLTSLVSRFEVDPWRIEISGECAKPRTLDLDDLFKFPHEERLYHFRCVERWAMNVPWTGVPLATVLKSVEPKSTARYVKFTSANRPGQMPGIGQTRYYPWPYVEGLRMDEAMNELAMLVTGAYGQPLTKPHGAPARIIVPWKYGYKNPKSIVKIELVSKKPKTFWQIQPAEYGFLSNVNPNIPHPRWSQAESFWIGRFGEPFPTPIFNGYEKYVAKLYPDEPRTLQEPLKPHQIAR